MISKCLHLKETWHTHKVYIMYILVVLLVLLQQLCQPLINDLTTLKALKNKIIKPPTNFVNYVWIVFFRFELSRFSYRGCLLACCWRIVGASRPRNSQTASAGQTMRCSRTADKLVQSVDKLIELNLSR